MAGVTDAARGGPELPKPLPYSGDSSCPWQYSQARKTVSNFRTGHPAGGREKSPGRSGRDERAGWRGRPDALRARTRPRSRLPLRASAAGEAAAGAATGARRGPLRGRTPAARGMGGGDAQQPGQPHAAACFALGKFLAADQQFLLAAAILTNKFVEGHGRTSTVVGLERGQGPEAGSS